MTEPENPSVNGVAPQHAEWARYSGAVRILVLLNALVALVLELAMFAFVAWWGLALDLPLWARILIAAAAFGALAVLWGTFVSPKARMPLPTAGTVAFKAAAFGIGALALWSVGYPEAAIVFAVLAAASTAIVTYVRTRPAI